MVITSSFMSTCPTRAPEVASSLRMAVVLMAASWGCHEGVARRLRLQRRTALVNSSTLDCKPEVIARAQGPKQSGC
jgi:hypothetical protein